MNVRLVFSIFIMSLFKHSLLFLCAIFVLSSCSTMKHQRYTGGASKFGWQVDNNKQREYNQEDLYYYIAVAEYGDLICLEVGDGVTTISAGSSGSVGEEVGGVVGAASSSGGSAKRATRVPSPRRRRCGSPRR